MNRFEASTITSVAFSDDSGFKPRRQALPTIRHGGVQAAWASGTASAATRLMHIRPIKPGDGRDTFAITIRDPRGIIVTSIDGAPAGGNIQSLRLDAR